MPLLIGSAVAAIALIVVLVLALGSGGRDARAGESGSQLPAKVPAADPAPGKPRAPAQEAASSGKTPDRPAPPIEQAVLDVAERHYQAAKDLINDAKRKTTAGDKAAANIAARDASIEMEMVNDALRAYTDWLAEADMDDWQIPAEYLAFLDQLAIFDKLRIHIEKMPKARDR